MGRHSQVAATLPWHRRPRYPLYPDLVHRPLLFVPPLILALVWVGASAVLDRGPLGNGLVGALAVLAGLAMLVHSVLYLRRPATLRRPPEPTVREDLRDLGRWLRRRAGR